MLAGVALLQLSREHDPLSPARLRGAAAGALVGLLVRSKAAVVLPPFAHLGRTTEGAFMSNDSAKLLHELGVPLALSAHGNTSAGESLGRQAGWAMRGGLPFDAALAAVTIVYGSVRALFQDDLKRRLAYSTVSALGTMVFLLGIVLTMVDMRNNLARQVEAGLILLEAGKAVGSEVLAGQTVELGPHPHMVFEVSLIHGLQHPGYPADASLDAAEAQGRELLGHP